MRSGDCESRFALKSNGSAYRRALFRLERGVCVACRLDCHALVKRLQARGGQVQGLGARLSCAQGREGAAGERSPQAPASCLLRRPWRRAAASGRSSGGASLRPTRRASWWVGGRWAAGCPVQDAAHALLASCTAHPSPPLCPHPPALLPHKPKLPPPTQARGYKAYLDALVRRSVEGNAWQADHITPVYKARWLAPGRL